MEAHSGLSQSLLYPDPPLYRLYHRVSDIHGLAHVSEFQDVYPNKKIEDVFKEGETYTWNILSIEPKSHRMGLLPVKEKGASKEVVKEEIAA